MTVRSLLAFAWYRCTPAGKVEVMLETSFNPRKGYFLVDMPLRYDVVLSELQNMEFLGSLCEKFNATWVLVPSMSDLSATTMSKFRDCIEMVEQWSSFARI